MARPEAHKREPRPRARLCIRGWLVYGNLPWVVMGLGILFGGVPTIFHYFNPRNGPVVLIWYGTVIALWVASV